MLTAQEYGSKRQAVLAGSCAQEYGSCRFAAQEYGSGKVAAQEYGSSKVAAQEYGSQAPEAEPVTIASVRTTKWQALYVERGGTGVLCAATLYVCTSPAAKKSSTVVQQGESLGNERSMVLSKLMHRSTVPELQRGNQGLPCKCKDHVPTLRHGGRRDVRAV